MGIDWVSRGRELGGNDEGSASEEEESVLERAGGERSNPVNVLVPVGLSRISSPSSSSMRASARIRSTHACASLSVGAPRW